MKRIRAALLLGACVALLVFGAAACSKKPKYTVTFDTRGGSAVSAYSLKEGASIKRPADPVKEMFRFDGWYADADCTEAFAFGTMPAHDVTVYAGWLPEVSVKIEFDANGGTFAAGERVASVGKVGDPFTAPAETPVNEGYTFGGWYTERECQTSYAFYRYPETGFTLYAKWERDAAYAYVSYYGNGLLLHVQPVRKGESIEALHLFDENTVDAGWYADAALAQPSALFGTSAVDDAAVYTRYYTEGLTIEDGVVTGYDGNSRTVVVPDKFDGVDVVEIGAYAFYKPSDIAGITSVQLPSTVKKIAAGAFYDCKDLVSVNLTSSVTEIGARAFHNNRHLRSIGDISSVTRIAEGVFAGCENLKAVTLSENVTEIEAAAFVGCSSLTEFTVPSSVRTVANDLFKNCTSLTAVDIRASVLSTFGKNVFDGCSSLKSVTIRSVTVVNFEGSDEDYTTPFGVLADVKIFVPVGVMQQYRSMLGYLDGGTFADKIAEIAE